MTVEDGHSFAEQAVYEAMYRAGKSYQGDSRILTIGLRTLADLSRMAYSNCKANVRSLIAKRAIDELPGFSYTDGRTYIIYGERDVLLRRRESGLTHVLRTRGVAFVDPESGAPKTGAPRTGAPGSCLEPNLESNAPDVAAPGPILDAIRSRIPDANAAAAETLWRCCRDLQPGASPGDVAYFVHLEANKPGVTMGLGFLLAAVPRRFQEKSWQRYREQRRAEELAAGDRKLGGEAASRRDADGESGRGPSVVR